MKAIGIVLIVLGLAALAYQGFTYTSRETVVDIGPLHATADREKPCPFPDRRGCRRRQRSVPLLSALANARRAPTSPERCAS